MARTKNRFNAIGRADVDKDCGETGKTEKYRTALYARLSVELKTRPSESIANQLIIMHEYVKERPELAECTEYIDHAVSGTSFDRPQFNMMMDDAKEGKINCIIVKDLSRFGRDYIESCNFIETIFPFLGIRFISINDHFDTEDGFNQNKSLEVSLKNMVNDIYAKDISRRVTVSRRLDMEKGRFTGSNAPYGYKVDKNDPHRGYIVDEPAAEIVKQIFEMAADGMTLREISKSLQEYGLSIPGEYLKTGKLYAEGESSSKTWYIGTLSNMLNNQAYVGNMVQGKRRKRLSEGEERHFTDKEEWIVVENAHEPIIDKALFERVRKVFDKKLDESTFTSDRGKNLPVKPDIFAGILFCGKCGKKIPQLSRIIEKDGRLTRQYYYSCVYNGDSGRKKCGCTILESSLTEAVYKTLELKIAAMTDYKSSLSVLQNAFDNKKKLYSDKISKLEKMIDAKKYDETKAYEAYVTGKISREQFQNMQVKTAAVIDETHNLIVDEQKKCDKIQKQYGKKLRWLKAIYKLRGKPELDREILETMVDSIFLYPDKKIQINLNFRDEYLADGQDK